MSRQPQPAEKSVLLDFISPNILFAWLGALRGGHIKLAAALSGSILNKILIVLSSGLFTVARVEVISTATSLMGQGFSGASFNSSSVKIQPISRVYGIDTFNMSYPFASNGMLATELPPSTNGLTMTTSTIVYTS